MSSQKPRAHVKSPGRNEGANHLRLTSLPGSLTYIKNSPVYRFPIGHPPCV